MVLPELAALERILQWGRHNLSVQVLHQVCVNDQIRFPIYAVMLGNPDPQYPGVAFVGGVHGLERIGTDVVLTFLHSLVMRLQWDSSLHQQLAQVRLVFVPLLNPGGMALGTRANPQGVDLMRNAPVQAQEPVPYGVGGQRWSARLPWYRGPLGESMQPEAQVLCDLVERELLSRPMAISVDCHSGFGVQDRLWFPYAHRRDPIEHLAEIQALRSIFERSHNPHRYRIEPQSVQYLAHGDLWDYLYLRSLEQPQRVFLPLTLEMGSWLWIKKNPRQLFSRHGLFNPLIEHRQQRVLRQHQMLLEFMVRAAQGWTRWMPTPDQRSVLHAQALLDWY
ncbi:MAG: M14 family metallopeptidase [Rhodoferax sp.]